LGEVQKSKFVENRAEIDERCLPVIMAVRTANLNPGMQIQ